MSKIKTLTVGKELSNMVIINNENGIEEIIKEFETSKIEFDKLKVIAKRHGEEYIEPPLRDKIFKKIYDNSKGDLELSAPKLLQLHKDYDIIFNAVERSDMMFRILHSGITLEDLKTAIKGAKFIEEGEVEYRELSEDAQIVWDKIENLEAKIEKSNEYLKTSSYGDCRFIVDELHLFRENHQIGVSDLFTAFDIVKKYEEIFEYQCEIDELMELSEKEN